MTTFAAFLILGFAVALYLWLLALLIGMAIYLWLLWLELLDQFRVRRSRKRPEQKAGR